MSEYWAREMKAELERLSRSKEALSLGMLEEGADPEKEGVLGKSSDDREHAVEVPVETAEKVTNYGEELKSFRYLFANLASRLKKTLVEMRRLTEFSQMRFKDLSLGQQFHRSMTDHIDKSEANLDCFLDYLRIKSPVRQTNMIHVILEEALEKRKMRLLEKKIKISKKQYEKDLPEARVHVEELRFILNWVLDYIIISLFPNLSIGFLTRSLEVQGGTKCIEILIVLDDYEKPSKQIRVPLEIKTPHNEGERDFILLPVNEIVQKNRALLRLFADSEEHLRMVSLRLPVERRKVIYYQPVLA